MKLFNQLLTELNACYGAKQWASYKPIEEIVNTCHRGDWLLWLAKRIDIDHRKLTLAKAHCANTVRHLMKDERSTNAIDVAIMYGNGWADDEQLKAAAYAADAAAAATYAAAYASDAAAADAQNRLQTADICREHIGQLIIDKVNEMLTA